MPAPARAVLVYDTACGSCTKFASVVRALDTKKRIDLVSMYDPAIEKQLRPRLGDEYDLSFHLFFETEDRVVSGEDALQDLARLLPALRPFAAALFKVPLARELPAALYRYVSAGRKCATEVAAA